MYNKKLELIEVHAIFSGSVCGSLSGNHVHLVQIDDELFSFEIGAYETKLHHIKCDDIREYVKEHTEESYKYDSIPGLWRGVKVDAFDKAYPWQYYRDVYHLNKKLDYWVDDVIDSCYQSMQPIMKKLSRTLP